MKKETIRCEKCDNPCEQITGAEAEMPYKGFDSNLALMKCTVCHHEFEPSCEEVKQRGNDNPVREFYKSINGSEKINSEIHKGDPDDCQFDTGQLFWFAEAYHQSRINEVTEEEICKKADGKC